MAGDSQNLCCLGRAARLPLFGHRAADPWGRFALLEGMVREEVVRTARVHPAEGSMEAGMIGAIAVAGLVENTRMRAALEARGR
jgi:hypothetical protein